MARTREQKMGGMLGLLGVGLTFGGLLLSRGHLADLFGIQNLAANLAVILGLDLGMAGLLLLSPDVLQLRLPGRQRSLAVVVKPRQRR
jgi:hypothetical protein